MRRHRSGTLSLTITESGDVVSGTLAIEAPSPLSTRLAWMRQVTIPVIGSVAATGALHLTGSTTIGEESFDLAEWSSVADSANRMLVGPIVIVAAGFTGGFHLPQTLRVSSELCNVTRQ